MGKKFYFALSGLNFLYGAYNTFLEERKIYLKSIKNYPNRESSYKAKKMVIKLNSAVQQIGTLIKTLEKDLTI